MTGDAVRWEPLCCHCRQSRFVRFIFLRGAPRLVTTDAIVHRECFERPCRRPCKSLHRTMAGLTLEPRRRHMGLVWKKNVFGETPDSSPWNLLPLFAVGADFFYLLALGVSAHVAAQTQRRGRTARHRVFLRSVVTRRAGEIQIEVSLMRKSDRLLHAGAVHPVPRSQECSENDEKQKEAWRCVRCHRHQPQR